ncbi:MAG: DUF308 domain-containing protein [Bacteroidales bacterium]|nr:DUF308 domain-containing protein [Bacteroidales bacterium]
MESKVKTNWNQFLVGGLVALVYGLVALLLPGGLLETVMTISGIVVIVAGVICLLVSLRRRKNMQPWGLLLFESVVMILLGVAAIVWSQKTVELLIIIIGVWVAVIGLMQLFALLTLSKFVYRGFFIVCSLLALAFGVLMIINPFESAEFFVKLTGAIALVVGILTIMFAFAVRSLQGKANRQLQKESASSVVVEDAEVVEE